MAKFYDGSRMRERYPDEKKSYNSAVVVLKILYGPFHLAGLVLARFAKRCALWAAGILRAFG